MPPGIDEQQKSLAPEMNVTVILNESDDVEQERISSNSLEENRK
jgi:hypothetical protein